MERQIMDLKEDWAKILHYIANASNLPIPDADKMDVFDFFSLYKVATRPMGK